MLMQTYYFLDSSKNKIKTLRRTTLKLLVLSERVVQTFKTFSTNAVGVIIMIFIIIYCNY
jgi:hypothetical protein